MKFKLENVEYEVIDLINNDSNNYIIYKECNSLNDVLYAAGFIMENRNITLKEIEDAKELEFINKIIKEKGEC